MQSTDEMTPRCAACGAAAVLCVVGVDRIALDAALSCADIERARALRPWQCSSCGRSDAAAFDSLPAATWLDALQRELARHDAARARAYAARERFRARGARLVREAEEQARERAAKSATNASRAAMEAALARARASKQRPPTAS